MAICEVTGTPTINELLERMTTEDLMDWWLYWFYYGDPIARGNIWATKGRINREKSIRVSDPERQREILRRNCQ